MLKEALLSILLHSVPPGVSYYSLEVATECAPTAASCEGAKWSSFYGTWVRKESESTARDRYERIAGAVVDAAEELTCINSNLSCTPPEGVFYKDGRRRWTPLLLSSALAAAVVYESGLREDVMVGRGSSRRASDDGGKGRGWANEGCLVQIHPAVVASFADAPDWLRKRAKRGSEQAREQIMKTLLGGDYASLKRCFRAGMRMLIRADLVCRRRHAENPWDYAMYSMYSTGHSCASRIGGQSELRSSLFRRIVSMVRASCAIAGAPSCVGPRPGIES